MPRRCWRSRCKAYAAAERRTRARRGRPARRRCAALQAADMVVALSAVQGRSARRTPTCCCRSRRSPRPPAPSSMPKAACRASTAWSSRWARARPAWKVLRVLGNLLGLPGFDSRPSEEVRAEALGDMAELAARLLTTASTAQPSPARPPHRAGAHRRRADLLRPMPWCAARRRCSDGRCAPPVVGVNAAMLGRAGPGGGDTVRVSQGGAARCCPPRWMRRWRPTLCACRAAMPTPPRWARCSARSRVERA